MSRPNFLLVLSDEHQKYVAGCYGNPQNVTPNLDALAERGTLFSRAYTTCPICVPARASLATGKYVHEIGNWDNAFPYNGILVHHRYVGTPRDAVTARYGEGFYRFFIRVLGECWTSAFTAERAKLAKKDLPWYDTSNPFFLYWGLQGAMLILAFALAGWAGVGLFIWQALIAVWHLELVNYVEHYGLTRKHLGEGKYEHVKPHHSWNAAHRATNWLLINLQRHSDHHYKPSRRYPLLQNYSAGEAPQLPYGYGIMTFAAMVPRLWRARMNPRVRKWREMYYPEILDWSDYNRGTNPLPR